MTIQRVMSKWTKTKLLLKSENLRQFIPSTKLFSHTSVLSMLNEYGMVYIKPINGTGGKGVLRVERTNTPYSGYLCQLETTIRFFPTYDQLYRSLIRQNNKRRCIVQKGIHLLRHQNRRFDIRLMLQKNLQNEWEVTGIMGRLAHPSKIVTNYHSGGTPLPFELLMSDHLSPSRLITLKNRLRKIGLLVASQLQGTYPNLKELGVDFALDNKLHPWILEVNSAPDPYIFRHLPNKKIFKRIYRYAAAYGKFKHKRRKLRKHKSKSA